MRVHGGIGFTWEHDSHLYLKRVKLDEVLFGTPSWHRRRLADAVFPTIAHVTPRRGSRAMSTAATWSGKTPRELTRRPSLPFVPGSGSRCAIRLECITRCRRPTRSVTSGSRMATTTRSTPNRSTPPTRRGARRSLHRCTRSFPGSSARPVSDAERGRMSGGDPARGHRSVHVRRAMAVREAGSCRRRALADAIVVSQLISGRVRSAEGRAHLFPNRVGWEDEHGDPFASPVPRLLARGQGAIRQRGQIRELERPATRTRIWPRIDACYRGRASRGSDAATSRRRGQSGEQLGTIAKGPLSVTDLIAWHVGVGWGMYGGGASRWHTRTASGSRSSM